MAAQKLVKVVLNQTRNVYDRGRFLAGDGITEYEVTEETAKTIREQGWGLPGGSETEHTRMAKSGESPMKTIGMAGGYRKVEKAEPIETADELDYSKVPTIPETATVVVESPRSLRVGGKAEIVPSDVGEKAVGKKSGEKGGGDATPGRAKRKGRHVETDQTTGTQTVVGGDEKKAKKSRTKTKS